MSEWAKLFEKLQPREPLPDILQGPAAAAPPPEDEEKRSRIGDLLREQEEINKKRAAAAAAREKRGLELAAGGAIPAEQVDPAALPSFEAQPLLAAGLGRGAAIPPSAEAGPAAPRKAGSLETPFMVSGSGARLLPEERERLGLPQPTGLKTAAERGKKAALSAAAGVLRTAERPLVAIEQLAPSGPMAERLPLNPALMGELAGKGAEKIGLLAGGLEALRGQPQGTLGLIGYATLENAPQLAVTAAAAFLGGAPLAYAAGFTQEFGGAYKDAIDRGATKEDAQIAAAITGTVNGFLEFIPWTKGPARTLIRNTLEKAAAEGGTEALQEVAQEVAASLVWLDGAGIDSKDIQRIYSVQNLKRYGLAAIVGAILGGGMSAVQFFTSPPPPQESQAVRDLIAGFVAQTQEQAAAPEEAPPELQGAFRLPPQEPVEPAPAPAPPKAPPEAPAAPSAPPEPTSTPRERERRENLIARRQVEELTEGVALSQASDEQLTSMMTEIDRAAAAGLPYDEITERAIEAEDARRKRVIPTEWDRRTGLDVPPRPAERAPGPPIPPGPAPPPAEPAAAAPGPSRDFEGRSVAGSRGSAVTPSGQEVEFEYRIAPLSSLLTSHDPETMKPSPGYPPELQPRQRERAASEMQVEAIASAVDPKQLGESRLVQHGSPLVGPDGIVESGNARAIALWRAKNRHPAQWAKYQLWLRENSGQFGATEDQVSRIEDPVLVRVRRTEVDRAAFAREANVPPTAGMSPTEQARVDAARLSDEALAVLEREGEDSPEFIREFMSGLTTAEQGALMDEAGGLNVQGRRRVEAAVLAKAYDQPQLISKLVESDDNNIRTIGRALVQSAASAVKFQQAVKAGTRFDLGIAKELSDAALKISGLRKSRKSIEDHLRQVGLLEEDDPVERSILESMVLPVTTEKGRVVRLGDSSDRLSRVLTRYTELADQAGDPRQRGLFGTTEPPSKATLWRQAAQDVKNEIEHEQTQNIDWGTGGGFAAHGPFRTPWARSFELRPKLDGEARRIYRQIVRTTHPDHAKTVEDMERRMRFIVQANALADRGAPAADFQTLLDAWARGDESPPGAWRARPGPRRKESAKQEPPPRRPEPPLGKPPKDQPRRGVKKKPSNTERFGPWDFPELVALAEQVLGGKRPRVRKWLQNRQALGIFSPRRQQIDLKAALAGDLQQMVYVLAHEIGHAEDFAPDMTMARGNILGSVAKLKKYLRKMVDELPTKPSKVFSDRERSRIYSQAHQQTKKDLGPNPDPAEFRTRRYETYQEMLLKEMDKRGLVDHDTIADQLWTLSNEMREMSEDPSPEELEYRRNPREIYADFVGAILVDPPLVREVAPDAWALFFNYGPRREGFMKHYLAIQDAMRKGRQARLEERSRRYAEDQAAGAAWSAKRLERQKIPAGQQVRRAFAELFDWLVDEQGPVLRMAGVGVKGGLVSRKDAAKLEEAASALAFNSAAAYDYADGTNTLFWEPLMGYGFTPGEVGQILQLRRAIAEPDKFAKLGEQGIYAAELKQHIEQKVADRIGVSREEAARIIEDAALRWFDVRSATVFPVMEESEALTKDLEERFKANPHYVRFQVIRDLADDPVWGQDSSLSAFKKREGSLAATGDVVFETMRTDLGLLRFFYETGLKRQIVEMARKVMPDQVRPATRVAGGRVRWERGRTMSYMHRGKMEAWILPEDIVRLFEIDAQNGYVVASWLRRVQRFARGAIIDYSLPFMVFNLPRDFSESVRKGYRGGPFRATAAAVRAYLATAPELARWVAKGKLSEDISEALKARAIQPRGVFEMQAGLEADDYFVDMAMARMGVATERATQAPRTAWRKLLNLLFKPFGGVRGFNEFAEKWSKVAGWHYLKSHPELGLTESRRAYEVRTRFGTPAYTRRGRAWQLTNTIFMFSNVSVQGLRADIETFRERPAEQMYKLLVMNIIPKAMMAAAALGYLGDALKRLFEKIPDHDLRNYGIVPWGPDENNRSMYTRVPTDYLGRTIGNAAWVLMMETIPPFTPEGEEEAPPRGTEDRIAEVFQMLDEINPFSKASMHPYLQIGSAWWDFLAGRNPEDAWLGRGVFAEHDWGDGQFRWSKRYLKKMTKWTWSKAGGRTFIPLSSERLGPPETSLERLQAVPFLGPLVQRLVKVSDYGLAEDLWREVGEDVRDPATRRRHLRDEVIEGALHDDPKATPAEVWRLARQAGIDTSDEGIGPYNLFAKRTNTLRLRLSRDIWDRAMGYAQSEREREIIRRRQAEAEGERR